MTTTLATSMWLKTGEVICLDGSPHRVTVVMSPGMYEVEQLTRWQTRMWRLRLLVRRVITVMRYR